MVIDKIKRNVIDYFDPYFERINQRMSFTFSDGSVEQVARNFRNIPNSTGIWSASATNTAFVSDLFISYSAFELLCFCHFHTKWINSTTCTGFAAIGLRPQKSQIRLLKDTFPNAKIHTVFDADMIGAIMDCKAALWKVNRDAVFLLKQEFLICEHQSRKLAINRKLFSLNRFSKTYYIKPSTCAHKPKYPFSTFFEQIFNDR